ncbi:hypothetical protein KC207_14525 [Phycicoccus sp. BSK3Z-2]|uniref:Sensor domain-containing protein n=1 Tax=Phycicoccus avicenniae TaxID=2828860 RepID=A0A941D9P0_9MICO|nr:hypothetical protein [Phycicoccus avicenniae]MBR7744508.1 hypothetical protein [Phycicoccus avicenniae]
MTVRVARLTTLALVGVLLAGCAPSTPEETPVTSTPAAPDPSPDPTPSTDPVPSPPEPYDPAAQRVATGAFPAPEALPEGWTQVDPTAELPQYPGDPEYCGVALERETAPGASLHLYEQSDAGPYVLQYTYVLPDGVAEEVVTDLAAAVERCVAEGRDAEGRVFAAKQAPTVGDASVSVAFVADAGAVSQVTVFRRGGTLVALVGFNPAGLPPLEALGTLAQGVDARLRAG